MLICSFLDSENLQNCAWKAWCMYRGGDDCPMCPPLALLLGSAAGLNGHCAGGRHMSPVNDGDLSCLVCLGS